MLAQPSAASAGGPSFWKAAQIELHGTRRPQPDALEAIRRGEIGNALEINPRHRSRGRASVPSLPRAE